jgi:hypothetical protein
MAALASGGAVLVHCFRGKSRSTTAVVQYLMHTGLKLKVALDITKAARPSIDINVGFRQALMDLEKELWPHEPPSVLLSLKSKRPVLTSAARSTSNASSSATASCATTFSASSSSSSSSSTVRGRAPPAERQ